MVGDDLRQRKEPPTPNLTCWGGLLVAGRSERKPRLVQLLDGSSAALPCGHQQYSQGRPKACQLRPHGFGERV